MGTDAFTQKMLAQCPLDVFYRVRKVKIIVQIIEGSPDHVRCHRSRGDPSRFYQWVPKNHQKKFGAFVQQVPYQLLTYWATMEYDVNQMNRYMAMKSDGVGCR